MQGQVKQPLSSFDTKQIPRLFVELFVVILGVGIALAADSWREDWVESQKEELYLQRLAQDLNNGIEILYREREIFSKVRDSALILSNVIENRKKRHDDSFVIDHLIQAGQHGVARAEMQHDLTFRELIESGQLGLIDDPKLREDLIRYYREVDWLITDLSNLPEANRSFIETVGLFPAEFGEYGEELTSTQREKLIAVAFNDPELSGLLRRLHANLVFHDRLFVNLIPMAQNLATDIESITK